MGLALAAHHPLSPAFALASFAAMTFASSYRPIAWLTALPALLPVLAFAPWSGWISFEEVDLLVLAVAAGGYARIGIARAPDATVHHARHPGSGASPLFWFGVLAMAASVALSTWRGFEDAGGFEFGWTQGYREPMNSLRLAKPFFAALLLWPLWSRAQRAAPDAAASRLGLGLLLGLAGASLAALWERLAFTGLLDFSSDYRTTALFWEMNVGGAALDGFLALTLPFALRELLVARSRLRWAAAAAVTTLGGYACLTTFSRMVYLAVPVGLAVLMLLEWRQRDRHPASGAASATAGSKRALAWLLVLGVGFTLAALTVFPAGGYRSMLAVCGAVGVLLFQRDSLAQLGLRGWIIGLISGAALGLGGWALMAVLPKGAYLGYAAAIAATLGVLAWQRLRADPGAARATAPFALAGFVAVLVAGAAVARHWGGPAALQAMLPVLAALLLLAAFASRWPGAAWPGGVRYASSVLVGLLLVGAAVGVAGGGVYMAGRFATSSTDLDGRLAHWQRSLALLGGGTELLLGKGLGRYPDSAALAAPADQQVGDYRVLAEPGNRFLVLSAGTMTRDWNEYLRVTQRVAPPVGAATLRVDVRSREAVNVHFEVCAKHLLYDGGCQVVNADIAPTGGQWKPLQLVLRGEPRTRGDGFAPRLIAFSIVTVTSGGRVDFDNLVLAGADGRNLLANAGFEAGMERWFFTSDRVHLPWHAKNLALNTLFDQGLLGLGLLVVLGLAAVWRVTFGAARAETLAPALAASLIGFAIVGFADSLLDVPRIGLLFWFLVLIALTLQGVPAAPRRPPSSRPARALAALLLLGVALAMTAPPALADTLRVGPQRALKTIAAASHLARDGDTVLVDAGEYRADVAVWTQQRLTLRADGGRVRLLADGAAAEAKAIWVIRNGSFDIEGFDFEGAVVPDGNGAGIRFERGHLRLRDCRFLRNETGVLTGNDPAAVLEVDASEFAHNLQREGYNHLLYAGSIARLEVRGSHFHHARSGHLLKSRAALSRIFYNRLTDEPGGNASYELEFANGGVAEVVGNIVQQGAATENPVLVSYGAEGYRWPENALRLVHNTLVNELPGGGIFLRVKPGSNVALTLAGNLLVGPGSGGAFDAEPAGANPRVPLADLVAPSSGDFRLRNTSAAWQKAIALSGDADRLRPTRQYHHPRGAAAMEVQGRNPGALQDNPAPPR